VDNEKEDRAVLEAASNPLSGGESESVAAEKMEHNVGPSARGFAFTRSDGTMIVNSVRETRDAVRLAGAEGVPIPVMIIRMADDSTVK
jgi:hypothetical protein